MAMVNMQDPEPQTIIRKDKVKPFKTPAQKRQRIILLATIAVIGAVGAAAYYLLIPREKTYILNSYELATAEIGSLLESTQASGSVLIPVQMSVTVPSMGGTSGEGYVEALYVSEGDMVDTEQPLVKISVPELEEDIEDLLADLDDAERKHEQSRFQYRFAEERAEREIERLREDLIDAEDEVARLEKLVEINASRESDLEKAVDSRESIETNIEEKEIALEEDRIMNALSLEGLEATVTRYRTRLARLREDLADATIRSPIAGEVLEIKDSLSVSGSKVTKGQTLFTIADRSSAVIDLEVPEQYSGVLTQGQQVALSVGGAAMTGTIDNIGRVATMSSDGLGATIVVRVLPEPGYDLLPGSSVVSEIPLGVQENVLLLPRGAYLTTGNQRYVYTVESNRAIRTRVTYGQIQSDKVQILNGLEDGDTVIISGYQNFIEYETITLGGDK